MAEVGAPRLCLYLFCAACALFGMGYGLLELEPTPPGASIVVPAGRATSVPFIAVLAGPGRTTTDSTPAPSTCAVP